jgi:hypothetical protein
MADRKDGATSGNSTQSDEHDQPPGLNRDEVLPLQAAEWLVWQVRKRFEITEAEGRASEEDLYIFISVRLKTKQIQLDIILCSIVSVG